MRNMFSASPWSAPQPHGGQNLGFRPGAPVQVNASGPFQLSGAGPMASRVLPLRHAAPPPAQADRKGMEGQCSDGSCELPKPSNVQPNRIPIGPKADCPVCHSFGGRR